MRRPSNHPSHPSKRSSMYENLTTYDSKESSVHSSVHSSIHSSIHSSVHSSMHSSPTDGSNDVPSLNSPSTKHNNVQQQPLRFVSLNTGGGESSDGQVAKSIFDTNGKVTFKVEDQKPQQFAQHSHHQHASFNSSQQQQATNLHMKSTKNQQNVAHQQVHSQHQQHQQHSNLHYQRQSSAQQQHPHLHHQNSQQHPQHQQQQQHATQQHLQQQTSHHNNNNNNNNTSKFQRLSLTRSSYMAKPLKPRTNAIVSTIKSGDVNLLNQLLQCDESANSTDDDNVPVLFMTLENSGKPDMLKILLDHGADPNSRHPIIHKTCLHVAAKQGYHLCARTLLAAGADPDAKDFRGNSAFMYALKFGHSSVAKVILQGSAKLNPSFENYVNNKGETLLHVAVEGGDLECVKLALLATPTNMRENADENGRTPLFTACKLNRSILAETLIDCIENFYNIDAQEKETGKTALHYAVENKNFLLIEHLLRLGANPNARNNNWETPFLTAVKTGLDVEVLILFINFQCDARASDRYFNTALHYAASEGRANIIPFLAKIGLDPNCKGDCGLSPLMIAAFRNYLECVKALLECGADPDLLDRNSASALVYSIIGSTSGNNEKNPADVANVNQLETVKLLLRHGIDMDKPAGIHKVCTCYKLELLYPLSKLAENRLYTPLEISYLKGNQEIFNTLIKASCDLHSFKLEFIEIEMCDHHHNAEHRLFHNMVKILREKRSTVRTLVEMSRKAALSYCKKYKQKEIIHFSSYGDNDNKKLIHLLNYNDLNDKESCSQPKTQTLTPNSSYKSLHNMYNFVKNAIAPDKSYLKKTQSSSSASNKQTLVFKKVESIKKHSPDGSDNSSSQNSKSSSPYGSNLKISNSASRTPDIPDDSTTPFKRSNSFKVSQSISKPTPSQQAPNNSPVPATSRLYSSMRVKRTTSSPLDYKIPGKSPNSANRLNVIPEGTEKAKGKLAKTFSSPEKPKKKEPIMQNFLLR